MAEDDPDYLTACLKELRQARDKGHLTASDGFRPESLAEEVGPFARFDDPEALLAAECTVVEEIAREFQRLGYRHLGRLLAVTPTRGQPLLAMAVQYYFRRAVGEDPVLARELSWAKMVGDRPARPGGICVPGRGPGAARPGPRRSPGGTGPQWKSSSARPATPC